MSDSMLATRFRVPQEYVIPEEDEARLRTLLNLPVEEGKPAPALPDSIRAGYYAMKRCCDILGCALTDWQIATVVCLAVLADSGAVKPVEIIPEMPPDFREIVRQQKTPMGELVVCEFGGEERPGFFDGFVGDQVQVQINGTERFLDLNKVRLAKDTEFVELPRNVNDK